LWPRGIKKEQVAVELWLKEVAPNTALRRCFGHDTGKWQQFCERYWAELKQKQEPLELLKQKSQEGMITLVYAARDEENKSAVALKIFLEQQDNS